MEGEVVFAIVVLATESAALIVVLAYYIFIFSIVIALLLDNERDSTSTVSWLLVFLFIPIFGPFLYLLFGRNWRKLYAKQQKMLSDLQPVVHAIEQYLNESKKFRTAFASENPAVAKINSLLTNNGSSPIFAGNEITAFHSGWDKFNMLMEDLEKATHSIHMEYFIWKSDDMTQRLKDTLIRKAKEGVEVRVVADAIGSLQLYGKYGKDLKRGGVQLQHFFDIKKPKYWLTLNHRTHRKIVIIDGKIAYVGGMNMAQEYADGGSRYEAWRDSHVRIVGNASMAFQKIFADTWYMLTKEELFDKQYFPITNSADTRVPLQVTMSGPDSSWRSIQQMYFSCITEAKDHIYIQSPYFVPDAAIHQALVDAALSGVDVRIMVTGVVDKRIPYWAAFTYFEEILNAGGKIYHYMDGFFHPKIAMVDGKVVSIGTANLDVRSFRLNYEINATMYDEATTKEFEEQFFKDLKSAKELKLHAYDHNPRLVRIRNSLARLVSPLL